MLPLTMIVMIYQLTKNVRGKSKRKKKMDMLNLQKELPSITRLNTLMIFIHGEGALKEKKMIINHQDSEQGKKPNVLLVI